MEKIILIGAGGHAKTIVDTIERQNLFEIAGFIDLERKGEKVYRTYEIVGSDEELEAFYIAGIHYAFVSIGYMGESTVRRKLYEKLKKTGFDLPVIIDKTAIVAEDVRLGEGTYIGRNAVLNAEAYIGKMCIINTAAVVEHESVVEDFSHIAVGAVLCGKTRVEQNVLIGANATLIQDIKIGKDSIIGAGSVVLQDIPPYCTAIGSPAKIIKSMGSEDGKDISYCRSRCESQR